LRFVVIYATEATDAIVVNEANGINKIVDQHNELMVVNIDKAVDELKELVVANEAIDEHNELMVANKDVGVANMANELNELVKAKGCDELDELAVAKGCDELNALIVAKGRG
jgi:hypothetical protein